MFIVGETYDHWLNKRTCQIMGAIRHGASGGIVAPVAAVVDNSIRLNDDDSAQLDWTPGVAQDNTDIGTLSFWAKRGNLDSIMQLYNAGAANEIQLNASNKFVFTSDGSGSLITTQVFRDPQAYFHLVIAWDTTQATASNRVKIYLNGLQITAFDTEAYPTQNQNLPFFGNAVLQTIGANEGNTEEWDGYLSQFVGIDGTQLTPTSFGKFDTNGVWQPTNVSGLTFGTNGFFQDYKVAPGTGNGAGTDVSGNANHFTDSGLAANDQVTDTPTDNFATANILATRRLNVSHFLPSNWTFLNGNLSWEHNTVATTGNAIFPFTQVLKPGNKYHFEFITDTFQASAFARFGINLVPVTEYQTLAANLAGTVGANTFETTFIKSGGSGSNNARFNGSTITTPTNNPTAGSRLTFEVDMSTVGSTTIRFTFDGTLDTTWTSLAFRDEDYYLAVVTDSDTDRNGLHSVNLGQQPFVDTVTAGFIGLSTATISAPLITDPSKHFQPNVRTGDGAAGAVTQTGNSQFGTDLVFIKNRDQADEWKIVDRVRTATKELNSDSTNAESTDANGVTAFSASDGYTIGTGANGYNDNTENFLDLHWKADGTTGASNSDGTITSTVAANDTAGFSIVTWTGTGANATVGHGLSAAPDLILVKQLTDAGQNWKVFHSANTSAPETDYLTLNTTAATVDDNTVWNDTLPSATVFSIGTHVDVNESGKVFVAYCFRTIVGFSSFGAYEGNADNDGVLIFVDFTPALFIAKNIDATGDWNETDDARHPSNTANFGPFLNLTQGESGGNVVDLGSNFVKLRNSGVPNPANTHVYMAWAKSPFGGSGVSPATAK